MFDMKQLMAKAQEMQQKVEDAKAQFGNTEYVGKSGGGMVSVVINGRHEMKKIDIDPSLIKIEDKEMLEDLVVAAYNEAKSKADAASEDFMSNMMGGMGLPPGFKMPF